MTMTIERYIALNNPREVAAMLEANGSRKIDKNNIMEVVHKFADKKGDYAYEQLAKIDTPYRRLILSQIEEEKKSGCSGCGGGCGEKKSGCCGSHFDGGPEKVQLTTTKEVGEPATRPTEGKPPVAVAPVSDHNKENNNLMIAGLVVLSVVALVVIIKK